MRFHSLSAALLATFAALQGVDAQAAQDGASLSSATTTYYTTRTLLRVVETVYATRNSSTFAVSTGTVASAYTTTIANGTSTVLGTGAGPSTVASQATTTTGSLAASSAVASSGTATSSTHSAAGTRKTGLEVGLVAVVGLAGMLAL